MQLLGATMSAAKLGSGNNIHEHMVYCKLSGINDTSQFWTGTLQERSAYRMHVVAAGFVRNLLPDLLATARARTDSCRPKSRI